MSGHELKVQTSRAALLKNITGLSKLYCFVTAKCQAFPAYFNTTP
jgi:hypothetical protein